MRIYDMHCDVLYKMLLEPELTFSDPTKLDVTYERVVKGGIGLQTFAIFLPEEEAPTFDRVKEAVRHFHRAVLSMPNTKLIKTRDDLIQSEAGGRIGAMLSLEGAEGLMGSMEYVREAFRMGIRCLGFTWNYANWAADGVLEDRKAGLTVKGKQLVAECNRLGMIIDISHLNEPGFWEVAELSNRPFIASHSNAYKMQPHPRNLNDEQIRAVIAKGGRIGVTFVPDFIGGGRSIKDVLTHLDHICSLGGEDHVGFGSDYDGIDDYLDGLANPADYIRLVDALNAHYTSEQVDKFLKGNWHTFLRDNLPR